MSSSQTETFHIAKVDGGQGDEVLHPVRECFVLLCCCLGDPSPIPTFLMSGKTFIRERIPLESEGQSCSIEALQQTQSI